MSNKCHNVQVILAPVHLSAWLSHTWMGAMQAPLVLTWLAHGRGKAASPGHCWALSHSHGGKADSPGHCLALSYLDGGKAGSPGHCWALLLRWGAGQATLVTAGLSLSQVLQQGRLSGSLLGSLT